MTEDLDAKESQTDSGSKTFVNKNRDSKKSKILRPLTKIILRRLPPSMTEEAFLEQVSPIPEHDYFYFAKPDPSLGNNIYSRAYINFVNVDDIYFFRDKYDGYVFLDEKGLEYVGIVEYAPFQRIPKKKKKKDPKCGTIESDPIFQDFVENLSKDPETENQPKLEYSYPVNDVGDKKVQTTPLLEYLAARKLDKRGRDERRRRENEKRKLREKKPFENTKQTGDISEEDIYNNNSDSHDLKLEHNNFWYAEQKVYHKTKIKSTVSKSDVKVSHGSDEFLSTDSDWDSHFPALTAKSHNTFTLTSGNYGDKKDIHGGSPKSGGDTYKDVFRVVYKDDKEINSTEGEKDKTLTDPKDEQPKHESKDGTIFESKTYRDQHKINVSAVIDKKKKMDGDKKEHAVKDEEFLEDHDKSFKKDKKDKFRESPREQKSKKYSDTRKERINRTEFVKTEKQSIISKMVASENKSKTLNYDDIKPFTQLPQVKTDDLTKIIEGMDKKIKIDDSQSEGNKKIIDLNIESGTESSKLRRNSLESCDVTIKDESTLKRQNSLDDRSKSTDREGSEEPEKSESGDRRTERRIRNKDRPSLVIYQPGMGKFSKQRLAKEKDIQPTKCMNDSEKKDT